MCWSVIYRFVLLSIICVLASRCPAQDAYIRLNAAIHCDTEISGGKYSPEELAVLLEQQKLDAAFITDHDHVSAEYGLAPFRNVVKYRYQRPSIHTFGAEKYIQKISAINKQYNDLIVFPGIEAVPFYHWEGSLLSQNLHLKNWHRHVLVLGLNSASDIEDLPSPVNKQYGVFSTSKIFTGGFALLGIFFFVSSYVYRIRSIKKQREKIPELHLIKNRTEKMLITKTGKIVERKQNVLPYSYSISNCSGDKTQGNWSKKILIIAGFLFCILVFINSYPFRVQKFSHYSNDYGAGPYQNLIDYVDAKNGLVFWAHPEAVNASYVWNIDMNTPAYPELLLETYHYTGFAIFWEGMKKVGRPGGIWDMVLNQYCAGQRKKPVWAIGELDFEDQSDPKLLRETLTSVWVRKHNETEILDALRHGRMYASRNFAGDFIIVNKYNIQNGRNAELAISGEEILCETTPTLTIDLSITESGYYQLQLIRNGEIIRNFDRDKKGTWRIEFTDDRIPSERKSYYRFILSRNNWPVIASNPIFVKKD